MAAPSLATEAAAAGNYPSRRFNKRERKILASVKDYVDSLEEAGVITSEGDLIVGDSLGAPARLALGSEGLPLVAGASTVSYAALSTDGLADGSVTLAKLDAGIAPAYIVVYAGSFTTAGGDANEQISVSGALSSDLAFVQMHTQGASPQTLLTAQAATDAINLVFSGDPSTDHIVKYQVLRAAS
jgi:hypothetical protein